jgi:cytosine/adenosine deaminase-related metal-dependent hydrolase
VILRARTIVPVTAPPVSDGAVWISRDQIRAVGPWSELREFASGQVVDLGDAAVFPGLVNAHCHLDYTGMAGLLQPTRQFPDWIKGILTLKSQWTDDDFAASWREGARQLLETGTTAVVNIETRAHQLAGLRASTPLRVFSYLEITGVRSARDPDRLMEEVVSSLTTLPGVRGGVGLSPHAPYSTTPDLLARAAATAKRDGWRLTTHVAESEAEYEMFMYRRGPMFSWLENQRSCEDCGQGSPVRHLHRNGLLGPAMLAVHVNYLWNDDARLLASRETSVAHCPRSHAYFGHRRFPREQLAEAGVNLCLGTDSLASVRMPKEGRPVLSMIDEMRAVAAADPGLAPRRIVQESTANPARALGLRAVIGELRTGALADLAVIPYAGPPQSADEALVNHRGRVAATMIAGRWEWVAPSWADRLQSAG